MRVTSYGLFWRESEIEWHPGSGNRESFRLLGRIGANKGKIRIADFRHQQGIYILYDDYGASYVGLTRDQGLGKRLKDHQSDRHRGKWDRFSWFGFRPVLATLPPGGMMRLGDPDADVTENTATTIGDLEALLIKAIGPRHNRAQMSFELAERWTQIKDEESEKFLKRLS